MTNVFASSSEHATKHANGTVPFYLYRPSYDELALASCYQKLSSNKDHRQWNFSSDAASWVDSALQRHPARVSSPALAQTIFLPIFAALSVAAGSCGGTSHFGRMVATADALKKEVWFQQRPYDLLLLNGLATATKNPLGELGQLVASRGGRSACLDPKLCGFFKPDKVIAVPWPSQTALQAPLIRSLVDEEACSGRRPPSAYGSRNVRLYFRGTYGTSKEAQELRVRLPMVRASISGSVQVTMIGSDHLQPTAMQFLSANKLSTNRLKRAEGDSYVRALMRAQFCLVPAGDFGTPGQRLYDVLAAGCIPILVGVDKKALPLSHLLSYSRFTGAISRSAFMKDPVYACESTLHKLEPQLGALRKALVGARRALLYGVGDDGPRPPPSTTNASQPLPGLPIFGDVAPLLLREHRLAMLPPAPPLSQFV